MVKLMGVLDILAGAMIISYLVGIDAPKEVAIGLAILIMLKGLVSLLSF